MDKFLIFVSSPKLQKMSYLTDRQRYTIEVMLRQGFNYSEIADSIGVHRSTVGREIKRNCDKRSMEYRHDLAQRKYATRQKNKPKHIRFTPLVKQDIEKLLKEDYSPEQVVGQLKKLGKATVSHERIYQYVWEDKHKGGSLHKHLRNQGRRYRKRGNAKDNRGIIKNRVSIDKRPEIVEQRSRFGDLEVDLIIGKKHKQAILTICDRASGMLKMRKVKSKQSQEVGQAMIEELQDWLPYIKTITADNGKEFADHQRVAESLGIDYYFAHPYHSWERGANENLNGLIRQYFKKSSDFSSLTHKEIKTVEHKINLRPRKRFNFENPIFVMDKLLFHQKLRL